MDTEAKLGGALTITTSIDEKTRSDTGNNGRFLRKLA